MLTGKSLHHYKRGKAPGIVKGVTCSGALSRDGFAAVVGSKQAYKGAAFKPFLISLALEAGVRNWEKTDHTKSINTVEYSRNGKMMVSAEEGNVTIVWDAAGNKLHELAGSHACFSPTGDRVLTAIKNDAYLWKLGNPPVQLQVFKGHNNPIKSVAFAPDGNHVLTAGDGTARLWDVNTGQERRFIGHQDEVRSAAFSPDGRRILTGSKDKTVRLWNALNGVELVSFTGHADAVNCVAYSPGGRRAASGSMDHTVRIWSLPK
jgi:WD40 repeat protein